MDFKNFTLNELKSNYKNLDIEIKINRLNENNTKFSDIEIKKFETGKLTITDYLNFTIHKGSENFYFDLTVYIKSAEINHPVCVQFYTKDNHTELNNIINEVLQQS